MRRTRYAVTFALVIVALAATSAFAGVKEYTFDASHSRATFEVRHIFNKVPGYFGKLDGTIAFDENDLEKSWVKATIDASSIFTDHEKRDGHLKSEDFFHVEKYPTLTFASKKVIPGEGKKFKIVGDLTMRGVTKEVTLDAELLGVQKQEKQGRILAGFEASTKVDRKEFGIVWNRALDQGGMLLGDDVEIKLSVEALHKTEAAAASN